MASTPYPVGPAPYQVGETVDITLRGATIRDVGNNFLDIETADGEEMCITTPITDGTEITRRIPAGGVQPGDVWEDSRNGRWFAVLIDQRYGEAAVKLTRDGTNTYPMETVHKDYVLVRRLFRAEPEPGQVEPEPAGVRVIEVEPGALVTYPKWNRDEPVKVLSVEGTVKSGMVAVRYADPAAPDDEEIAIVSADTAVLPYGGAQ